MARPNEKPYARTLCASLGACAAFLAACASYDGANKLHTYSAAEDGGSDFGTPSPTQGGGGAGGALPSTGGAPASAGTAAGGTTPGASGTGGDTGGSISSAGSGGSGGDSGASGGMGGGTGGGAAGTSSGGAAMAGAGGSPAVDQLLSQGKPATADSEETDKGNLAALGNDGSATTRWCAADGAGGHYWQVDLGKAFTLGKLQITWEKAVVYQFKVEGSADATAWSSLLDQTTSTNATAAQSYPLPTSPVARYVRITTTTLPNANIWASFFEFQVYGH